MLLGLRVDLDPFVLCQGAHERAHGAFSSSSVTRDHGLLREETIFWWRNNSYNSQQSFLWSTGYIHLLTEETILSWVPTAQFQMVLQLFNPSSGPLGRFQCSHLTGRVDSENRSDTPESLAGKWWSWNLHHSGLFLYSCVRGSSAGSAWPGFSITVLV